MRVVADTNVVVSGLLWQGPSRTDDDAVIACAMAAAAAHIISGDRDLLTLKNHQGIEIVKVAEFIARIRRE